MTIPAVQGPRAASSPAGAGRLDWIDTTRGIGIVLVVYAHAIRGIATAHYLTDIPFFMAQDRFIYSFHMPLFFLISGLFARTGLRHGRMGFLIGRIRQIAYPYFLWSALFVLLTSTIAAANHHGKLSELWGILWTPVGQYWFLYTLFLCQVLVMIPGRYTLALLAIAGLALVARYGPASMAIRTFYFLPYFATGIYLTADRIARIFADERRVLAIATIAWAAFLALYLIVPDALTPATLLGHIAVAFCGIAGTFAIGLLVASRLPVLALLGAASMPIYLMHSFVSAAARAAWLKLHLVGSPLMVAEGTVAGLLIPYLVARAVHRANLEWLLGFGPVRRTSPALEVSRAKADVASVNQEGGALP